MQKGLFLILSMTLLMITACQRSNQWTQWRGPQANGTIKEANWSPETLNGSAEILWHRRIGAGHSAVTVSGNRLYTMGNITTASKTDTLENDVIWCLDTQTGEPLWTHEYKCGAGSWPGPGSTPVIDGNQVYTLSREGHLFCLNNISGDILWQHHVIDDSLTRGRFFNCSGVIDGDLILFNFNRSGMAFNKYTGEVAWTSPKAQSDFPSPVLMDFQGRRIALILTKRKLFAVNAQTGDLIWEHRVGWGTPDPQVFGDQILFAGQKTALYRFTLDGPEPLWENREIEWQFQNPVVIGDYLFGLTDCDWRASTQPFHCIDMKTGQVQWHVDQVVWGSQIAVNNQILLLEGQGKLTVIDASPEEYRVIASGQAVPMADNTGLEVSDQCHCWTHPVLADGKIFARNNFGDLVCVNVAG